jgi:hypothetical protein
VCPQQALDQADQLAGGQDQRALVGMRGRLGRPWLTVRGLRVSPTAVRGLAEALAHPVALRGPRLVADVEEYVPPFLAARLAGVPARLVRTWLKAQEVASAPGPHGPLVRLPDVLALAEQARGRPPPRRPLRVQRGAATEVVRPGAPDYEDEYRLALRLHAEGVPMPYAEAAGELDEGH